MSRSKGKPHTARFCPFCGLERLQPDRVEGFRQAFSEFICDSCSAGFRILDSRRVQMAARLFKQHRALRVATNGKDKSQDQWKAACHKKFREIKNAARRESARRVGILMREWMQSSEARTIRDHLEGINAPLALDRQAPASDS
jgi:hypothetical protein